MNEEKNYAAPPVLDDIDYTAPTPKKGGPTGVSAPVLDDMDTYVPPPSKKRGAPTGVSAPVLDDDTAPYEAKKSQVTIMTDEEIIEKFTPEQRETYEKLPEVNRQKVLDLMRKQLGVEAPPVEVTAPVLDEDTYTPPPKEEKPEPPKSDAPIKAPVLDDAPQPTAYKPKYVDEDLERAKREAAKKAIAGQLVSDQKDSKESLRMMLELKEERRREMAQKGFKICILLGVVGVIAAVAFYLLYSGSLGLVYKDGISKIANVLKDTSLYIALGMAISGLLLMTGISFFKTLANLIYLLSAIAQIFPGVVMIPQHEGSIGLVAALYAVSIICTLIVFISMSALEPVALYFKKELRN